MSTSASLFGQVSDIKSASQDASSVGAQVFEKVFGEIIAQYENSNNADVSKPMFAYDFVQILADKTLALDSKNAILQFANSLPFLAPLIEKYYNDIENNKLCAEDIKNIYNSFASLEYKIFAQEAVGKETDKSLILNFQTNSK